MNALSPQPKFLLKLAALEQRAELRVTPYGVKCGSLEYSEIAEALEQKGISVGVQSDVIYKVCQSPNAYTTTPAIVAVGIPPTPGNDGFVEYLVAPERQQSAFERPDGTIDFRTISTYVNVESGTTIAMVRPPTAGAMGTTVIGRPAPPPPVKPAKPRLGANVVLTEDRIVSTENGHLTVDATGRISVQKVLEIHGDINFRTGNIDHVGNVLVRGDVKPGFQVRVKGDLTIDGCVEAATLEAGGNVTIRGVVLPGARVRAGRDVFARALESCFVEAGENVEVDQSILRATVSARRHISCRKGKGIVYGGVVNAGLRFQANELSNDVNMPVTVEVGVHPLLSKELSDLELRQFKVQAQLENAEKLVTYLSGEASQKELSPQKQQALEQGVAQIAALRLEAEGIALRRGEILTELRDVGGIVDVLRKAHAGVTVTIGSVQKRLDRTLGRCRFKLHEDQILVTTG